MAWAVLLSKGSAMGSQFQHAEIMGAAMQFGTTKTVDEVIEEHDQREKQAEQARKNKRPSLKMPNAPAVAATAPAPSAKPIPTSELANLRQMLALGHNRPPELPKISGEEDVLPAEPPTG